MAELVDALSFALSGSNEGQPFLRSPLLRCRRYSSPPIVAQEVAALRTAALTAIIVYAPENLDQTISKK